VACRVLQADACWGYSDKSGVTMRDRCISRRPDKRMSPSPRTSSLTAALPKIFHDAGQRHHFMTAI
jgi:hypothetical protein